VTLCLAVAGDSTALRQKFGTFHDVSIKRKKIARIGCIKLERLDKISFDALLTVTSTGSNGRLKLGSVRAISPAGMVRQ